MTDDTELHIDMKKQKLLTQYINGQMIITHTPTGHKAKAFLDTNNGFSWELIDLILKQELKNKLKTQWRISLLVSNRGRQ